MLNTRVWILLPLFFAISSALMGCPVSPKDFELICEPGFGVEEHAQDRNDYPWAMAYHAEDGQAGHVYVGTGNNITGLTISELGVSFAGQAGLLPPEIRRYRPDLGEKQWETVLGFRDIENEPHWRSSGIRALQSYYVEAEGTNYLYAGTLGLEPAVWRSPTGNPGTWEQVWTNPLGGSIRAFTVHDGLLYVAVTHEYFGPEPGSGGPGELYITDGVTFWERNKDGFGNDGNNGIFSIASYNGWLYAGTLNRKQGYQVWKLDGLDDPGPYLVVDQGGPSPANVAAGTMLVFQDALYVGSLIFGGINLSGGFPIRGADLIRIYPDDTWDTVVGPGSLGSVESGFGRITNSYLWSLAEYDGMLYCGTWDGVGFLRVLQRYIPDIINTVEEFRDRFSQKRDPTWFDILIGNGAELYRSPDGISWTPVFTDGLGNPDNYGVRNMLVVDDSLYLGLANIFDGLSIWRSIH